jgi:hypothetical protein
MRRAPAQSRAGIERARRCPLFGPFERPPTRDVRGGAHGAVVERSTSVDVPRSERAFDLRERRRRCRAGTQAECERGPPRHVGMAYATRDGASHVGSRRHGRDFQSRDNRRARHALGPTPRAHVPRRHASSRSERTGVAWLCGGGRALERHLVGHPRLERRSRLASPHRMGASATSATVRRSGVPAAIRSSAQRFRIRDSSENDDPEQQYNSRERSSDQPQLVVTFKPAP